MRTPRSGLQLFCKAFLLVVKCIFVTLVLGREWGSGWQAWCNLKGALFAKLLSLFSVLNQFNAHTHAALCWLALALSFWLLREATGSAKRHTHKSNFSDYTQVRIITRYLPVRSACPLSTTDAWQRLRCYIPPLPDSGRGAILTPPPHPPSGRGNPPPPSVPLGLCTTSNLNGLNLKVLYPMSESHGGAIGAGHDRNTGWKGIPLRSTREWGLPTW